jgi:hypothetical protein
MVIKMSTISEAVENSVFFAIIAAHYNPGKFTLVFNFLELLDSIGLVFLSLVVILNR